MEKEIKQIQGPKTVKWLGTAFIIFCIAAAAFAVYTLNADGDAPIEYDVSSRTVDKDNSGGKKEIYWRVKSTEVPRWKKFANRWKKVRSCRFFWESDGGFTRDYDPKRHPRWYHQNAEMSTEHTVDQFKQIQNNCRTVSEMKKYLKHEKAKYRTGTRRYIEKKKEREEKERIKNIWEEATTATADNG